VLSSVQVEEPSDEDLLRAYQAGDRASGDRLVQRHFDTVYRFFSNKVVGSVDDLVQETFAACIAARPELREAGGFRAYLLAAARSKLYTWLERRAREGGRIDWGSVSCADLAPSPSSAAARNQRQSLVLRLLRSLPVDLQVALELYYFEGLRGPELARVLGVPEGTVRTRLRRARQVIRAELEAAGVSADIALEGDARRDLTGALDRPRARGA
jgi:RNA polymerase sigma factor (sigma-70 family)